MVESERSALPLAAVAHHVPGRLRMVVPEARWRESWLEKIALEVETFPAAHSVHANPLTGSIVLQYRAPSADIIESLTELGRRTGLFELARGERTIHRQRAQRGPRHITTRGSQLGRELVTFVRILNREMKFATNGHMDLRLLMPIAAAVASAAIRARRPMQGTPFWFHLLGFAFNSFVALHRDVPLEVAAFGERAQIILDGAEA